MRKQQSLAGIKLPGSQERPACVTRKLVSEAAGVLDAFNSASAIRDQPKARQLVRSRDVWAAGLEWHEGRQ